MAPGLAGYILRTATTADEPFLLEMLYQAIHVPPGVAPPPRSLLQEPSFAHYVVDWGQRPGDLGLIAVAESSKTPVGAVWLRLLTAADPGWGYIDDATPELSISLLPEVRGQGLGSALIEQICTLAQGHYPAISLSVDPHNPAFRLYQRLGFRVVGMSGTSVTMHKGLTAADTKRTPAYLIRNFERTRDLPHLAFFGLDEATLTLAQRTAAEADLAAQMKWPGHDPAQDRWVVTPLDNPAQLIAHAFVRAQTRERSYGYIEVLPAWRRQGIGSALLACLRAQASLKRTDQLILNAAMDNAVGHAFLQQHDFQVAGHIRQLVAPVDTPLAPPTLPPGFTLCTLAEINHDLTILAAVQNRCYHDMWGHTENTQGEMNERRLKEFMALYPHAFAGVLILFTPDGEAVGVCYSRAGNEIADEQRLTIDSPGVAPEYRYLGLQRPLVLAAMQWLRQHYDQGAITLETYGDFDEAIALYQELGFVLEPSRHWVDYRLAL